MVGVKTPIATALTMRGLTRSRGTRRHTRDVACTTCNNSSFSESVAGQARRQTNAVEAAPQASHRTINITPERYPKTIHSGQVKRIMVAGRGSRLGRFRLDLSNGGGISFDWCFNRMGSLSCGRS